MENTDASGLGQFMRHRDIFNDIATASASRKVGREFASRPGHTKAHHKKVTNCLSEWHEMR